ncbi:MAG: hypothetical protein J6N78_02770 [Clostridia bacterium]|nr:hypothetical protein [Clostridia bacterium]
MKKANWLQAKAKVQGSSCLYGGKKVCLYGGKKVCLYGGKARTCMYGGK